MMCERSALDWSQSNNISCDSYRTIVTRTREFEREFDRKSSLCVRACVGRYNRP